MAKENGSTDLATQLMENRETSNEEHHAANESGEDSAAGQNAGDTGTPDGTDDTNTNNDEEEDVTVTEDSEEDEDALGTGTDDETDGDTGDNKGQEDDEGKKKDPHQETADDRLQKVLDDNKDLKDQLVALEAKFDKQQVENQPLPYIDVDMNQVETKIRELQDKAEGLRVDGKLFEAGKVNREINQIYEQLEANDKAKEKYLSEKDASKGEVDAGQAHLNQLTDAANFYRDENKIPLELWDKMGIFFTEAIQKDKVLLAEFQDRSEKSPIGAIKWAHEYSTKHMSGKNENLRDKKNTGKKKQVGNAGGETASTAVSKSVKSASEKAHKTGKTDDVAGLLHQMRINSNKSEE